MRELSLQNCRLDKRYDILRRLGCGSYAEIYLARDVLATPQSPHNLVVIKALNVFLQDHPDSDLERTLVDNFQNEAIALDKVRHPNIISRMGHGTARDLSGAVFHYIVLEYLSGGDLNTACRQRRLTPELSLKYVEQTCAGLRHAHDNGIIHRDIKPQNLLLTKDGITIKIADFGVARMGHADSPITRVGTNVYAPPEHSPMFAGPANTPTLYPLTAAADIYSLAKSMYTMICYEPPRVYANQPITALAGTAASEVWADELLRVLNRATSSDPQQRPQTVDAFWSDLAGYREMISRDEVITHVGCRLETSPQPHVTRGYTPIVPERPSFSTSRDLKLGAIGTGSRPAMYTNASPAETRGYQPPAPAVITNLPNTIPSAQPPFQPVQHDRSAIVLAQKPKKKRFFRSFASFTIVIAVFAGILFGTHSFFRNSTRLPAIGLPFGTQMAVATTDIYLRPEPTTGNDPIGLVTKNSRIRIVNSRNNWYEVDVVEQGRERRGTESATRGWLYGKYVEIQEN
ncbi:MAG: serine/threonine protein kinase [Pyrinomonadaceae bacterium]